MLGVPGLRGYFFGVGFSFLIIKIFRSLSSKGKEKDEFLLIFRPIMIWLSHQHASSSFPLDPFMAIKVPPTLTSGRQSSLNTDILATALAVTTS